MDLFLGQKYKLHHKTGFIVHEKQVVVNNNKRNANMPNGLCKINFK